MKPTHQPPVWLSLLGLPALLACTAELAGSPSGAGANQSGGGASGIGGAPVGVSPGPGGPGTDCATVAPAADQPRRLNRTELTRLAAEVLGVQGEPFARLVNDRNAKTNASLTVATGFIDDYEAAANDVATAFVSTTYQAGACTGAGAASCALGVLEPYLERLARRPLLAARRAGLERVLASGVEQELPIEEVLIGALTAYLLSPETLFVGTQVTSTPGVQLLDSYSVAERLALAIWSSVPDAELLAAAAADQLQPGAGLEPQIERMLSAPGRGAGYLASLAESYLHLSTLESIGAGEPPAGVDAVAWPGLTRAMAQESQSFLDHLFAGDLGISELLDARYAFLNRPLGSHYGIAVPPGLGEAFERVELPVDSPFQGLLTAGSLLVPTHKDGVPEIFRGKELNYLFACVELPVPASPEIQEQINAQLNDVGATQAQKYELRNSQAACTGCHQRMDPLGKAFNAFDTAGRYASTDANGSPIDTEASYEGALVAGPADVARLLKAKSFGACVASYVLGPMIHQALNINDASGWCAVEKVLASAGAENPGLYTLVTSALASDALRRRVIGSE